MQFIGRVSNRGLRQRLTPMSKLLDDLERASKLFGEVSKLAATGVSG